MLIINILIFNLSCRWQRRGAERRVVPGGFRTAGTVPNQKPDPQSCLPLTPLSFEILLSLADGPRHGYGIMKEAEERSGRPFPSSTGTLYLAIQRLQKDGMLTVASTEAEASEGRGSRGRVWTLTPLGRAVAEAEAGRLEARVRDARGKALLEGETGAGGARG